MLKKLFVYSILLLSLSISGCVAVLFGGAGAGATYSIVGGAVEANVDMPKDEVIEKFISVIEEENGTILSVSMVDGKVKAKIDEKTVYLATAKLTDKTTKIQIDTRRGFDLVPVKKDSVRLYKKLIEKNQKNK